MGLSMPSTVTFDDTWKLFQETAAQMRGWWWICWNISFDPPILAELDLSRLRFRMTFENYVLECWVRFRVRGKSGDTIPINFTAIKEIGMVSPDSVIKEIGMVSPDSGGKARCKHLMQS